MDDGSTVVVLYRPYVCGVKSVVQVNNVQTNIMAKTMLHECDMST